MNRKLIIWVRIGITDVSPNISPEVCDHLVTPFVVARYQYDLSRTLNLTRVQNRNMQNKFKTQVQKISLLYPNRTPVVTKYNFKLDQIKTYNDIKTMNFCLNLKFWIQTFFISSKNWWILVRIVLVMFRLNSDKFENFRFQA